LQVPFIAGLGYFCPPLQVRNAFAHFSPGQALFRAAFGRPINLESLKLIDPRLDAQHTSLLVICLQRVLAYPMAQTQPFRSTLEATDDLAFESAKHPPPGGDLLAWEA
jgi:hypothetical protein